MKKQIVKHNLNEYASSLKEAASNCRKITTGNYDLSY